MYRDKREDEDTEEQSDDQDWIPHTLVGPGGDTI